MDAVLLWAAGMLLRERIRLKNILLGAAAGSLIYILSLFFPYRGTLGQVSLTVFSVALSVTAAFRPKSAARLFQLTLMTVILAFAASGTVFSLMVLKAYSSFGQAADGIAEAFSYRLLVAFSAVFYIGIKLGKKWFSKIIRGRSEYFDIKLYMGDSMAEVRALADTGNSLRDSLSGGGVVIAEYEAIKSILPDIRPEGDDSVRLFEAFAETDIRNRLRLIPFKSIGEKNGLLLGIKTDGARIDVPGQGKLEKKDVIVCVYMGKLDNSGRFSAIINYEIIL